MSKRALSAPGWVGRHVAAQLHAEFKGSYPGSQEDLGRALGISQQQVSKLLRGTVVINVDQLQALCDELGLSSRDILGAAEHDWRLAQRPSD